MRTQNLSRAAAAGAIVSAPHELARWGASFGIHVFPRKELEEMTSAISERTRRPIPDASADDPSGFGLHIGRRYAPGGTFWFYQGTTLGFRVIFVYWPQNDLVITAATNSQPPDDEDRFGTLVLGAIFATLRNASLRESATESGWCRIEYERAAAVTWRQSTTATWRAPYWRPLG
jgi:D-alanyl-D-alanine carboxypeptidase